MLLGMSGGGVIQKRDQGIPCAWFLGGLPEKRRAPRRAEALADADSVLAEDPGHAKAGYRRAERSGGLGICGICGSKTWLWVKTVLGSRFGVGEFTTHFRAYCSGWIG